MTELERKAGYGLVIGISVTAMIGTGLFFGPAIAASYAGNASLLAWIGLCLISLYVGTCFAELSSLFPNSGGTYEFAKQAYGRFTSFIIGWVTWLVSSITPAVLIIAALEFLIPAVNPMIKIGVAIGLLVLLNLVALRGIEVSTVVLLVFAVITVGVILALIYAGSGHVNTDNYSPFFSSSHLTILVALFFIVESFFGWESATFMGAETKNPKKTIPKSIMIVTVGVAVLGLALAIITLGFIPWETLINLETTAITYILFGETGSKIANIAIFLTFIGSAAGAIVSSPRLILALAKDKLFIEQFSSIHPRYKTPHKAILFQTFISLIVLVIAFGNYQSLLSLLVPLALIMYIMTIITVPVLRYKFPDMKRYVKAPFGLIGPILISIVFIGVIVAWLVYEPSAVLLFQKIISFMLFGIPIYLLLNLYYNPDILLRTVNSFAPLSRFFESFILPKKVRNEILNLFRDIEGRKVLEFGSGVGTLTIPLAELVGPKGHIYATDLSPKNLHILNKRLEKKGLKHISIIHDEHLISRVHPNIPMIDMVFSVCNLSYVQNLKSVLQDMHKLLPENGQICFVEYIDYFWGLIPNQAWLDDTEKIEEVFRSVGFSIRVKKRNGLFWKYLFIYGIKSDYDVPVI